MEEQLEARTPNGPNRDGERIIHKTLSLADKFVGVEGAKVSIGKEAGKANRGAAGECKPICVFLSTIQLFS